MVTNNLARPEDIFPAGADSMLINGKIVRKGTITAFLANVALLEKENITEQQRQETLNLIKELAPGVISSGLHQHVVFKNKQIEQILVDSETMTGDND